MVGGYTDEELAVLSETERDALLLADETNDDDILLEIAGDDDNDDEDLNGGAPADDVVTTNPVVVGDEAATETTANDFVATEGEFNINDVPAVQFVPVLSGVVRPDFQARIDAIEISKQADLRAIETKLDDGEIDAAEYRRQVRLIEKEINQETRKLEAASQNTELSLQLWDAEQVTFFKNNPSYSKDSNSVLWGTLNQEVMRVAAERKDLSGIQTLYLAKANVENAFKAMFPTAAATPAATATAGDATVTTKPSANRPTHQTLTYIPSADSADIGQDKFAHLDKLTGIDLESAISRLSPVEQDAYLRGA